jgi:hypothetical protein
VAIELRKSLDDALDAKFPAYDEINQQYRELVTALKNTQRAMGSKVDYLDPEMSSGIGTKLRQLMANPDNRLLVAKSVSDMSELVQKYAPPELAGKLSADVRPMVMLANEMERNLGRAAVAPNSIGGELLKNAGTPSKAGLVDAAYGAYKQMTAPTGRQKLDALRGILN